MSTYFASRRWEGEDVEPGLWLSLGLKLTGVSPKHVADVLEGQVVEQTPRKFFSFKLGLFGATGTSREFHFTEPCEFDHIVVSRQPAGPVADVLHNGAVQKCGPNFPVMVTPHWSPYE